jgi:hypothetical protein
MKSTSEEMVQRLVDEYGLPDVYVGWVASLHEAYAELAGFERASDGAMGQLEAFMLALAFFSTQLGGREPACERDGLALSLWDALDEVATPQHVASYQLAQLFDAAERKRNAPYPQTIQEALDEIDF